GNQLFQYAHGRAEAFRSNVPLLLDISWYKGRTDRHYMLDNFNIEAKIATGFEIIKTRLFNKKNYVTGDWQSEKYFKEIESTIKKEFTLKHPSKEIPFANSVSIHLRGGDYARGEKSGFHGTCPPEYYAKAVEHIRSKVSSPHFFIFTDDIPW